MIRNLSSSVKHIMLVAKASKSAWPTLFKLNTELQDKRILMPLNHIEELAGNRFSRIDIAFNYWLNVPEEKLRTVQYVLDKFYNAVFLFDDIEDGASYRYGVPVAHSVYSPALTINAASQALAIALQNVLELGHPMAVKFYSEALLNEHRGQGIEIYWRDNFRCPSEEEYIEMIIQKTSIFVILTFQLLQLFSERQVDGMKFASLFGIYYQVRDDYCNLFNQKALESLGVNYMKEGNKNNTYYCSDIAEGKFTLPIIHALKHPEYSNQVLQILKQRTHDTVLIQQCMTILEELGSKQYTREVLETLETCLYNEIDRLGDNPMMTTIMNRLSDWR